MAGRQLHYLAKRYSAKLISSLPDSIKQKIQISNINKSHARQVEKNLQKKKDTINEKIRQKRYENQGVRELCDYEEEAQKITTDHDKGWSLRGAREEMEVIAEMLTKSWWNSVLAVHFHDEIGRVIPTFECELVRKSRQTAIIKKAKDATGAKIDLGAHLLLIKKIAKSNEKTNEINDVDLTGKTEDEALHEFIKLRESEVHTAKLSVKENDNEKIQAIFGHFGTDLSS